MSMQQKRRRIVIVSNRLPVSVRQSASGLEWYPSAGGLATGLSSLKETMDVVWVGWPGTVPEDQESAVAAKLTDEWGYHPVFLAEKLVEEYYEGYSNRTIWPIFHSFPAYAKYSANEWESYKTVNALFAQKVLEVYQPGDELWIHDYHLMMLPKLLRAHLRHVPMGFFLHIPFPHYDIFRLLPQHREILESLLTFNLIGFHTHDFTQTFLGNVRRLLGHDNTFGRLLIGNHLVHVDAFPMGIDYQRYSTAMRENDVRAESDAIGKSLQTWKTVFSVSRLDYTKGIPECLDAIEHFLIGHPEWHEKVVFVVVVVPSRENVEQYALLKRGIDESVGRINSTYGTLEWQPIRYIYRSLTFGELIGLYANAHVALVTPLRDGMNLTAKEYLAVRTDGTGVLILSDFAGAARDLHEALILNPNSREEIGAAIYKALTMPEEDQRRRNEAMRLRLEMRDVYYWVQQFLGRLREVEAAADLLAVRPLDVTIRKQLLSDYMEAPSRLILLDYDGTLVPFASTPEGANPDGRVIQLLQSLTASPRNKVVILSGRERDTLEKWLGHLDLTLVAEHGGFIREVRTNEWVSTVLTDAELWKRDIRPLMEMFVARIPGSLLEEKAYSLVWHYRRADLESAGVAAREMLDTLTGFTANLNVQVLPGNKIIEVRSPGIGKGLYYTQSLGTTDFPFILALGDDATDEDLFAVLPPTAYSVKIGPKLSRARFSLRTVNGVRTLLEKLSRAEVSRPTPQVFPLPLTQKEA